MGGLRKYMPITGTTFLLGTLSLCGIPPLSCFRSKDEIIAKSWLYSSSLGWITSVTAGFTAFYMFRIYLLTFEGNFRGSGCTSTSCEPVSEPYDTNVSLWGETRKDLGSVIVTQPFERESIETDFSKISGVLNNNYNKPRNQNLPYPKESNFVMLLPLILLAIPTLFAGFIGVNLTSKESGLDLLSEWFIPLVVPDQDHETLTEFLTNSIGSSSLSFVGLFVSFVIYGPNYSFGQNIIKIFSVFINEKFLDSIKLFIQGWSLNRGYIDSFYDTYIIRNLIVLSKFITFFDRWIIDGLINGTGVISLFGGEGIKYGGGGRISYYLFGLTFGVTLLLILLISVFPNT